MDPARYAARMRGMGRTVIAAAQNAAEDAARKVRPAARAASCEARLAKAFASIAPETAPTRVASGRSGAVSHAARLDDVFGGLNAVLRAPSPPPVPPAAAATVEPAPSDRSAERRPTKRRLSRPPPPKPGFEVVELGGVTSSGAERAAAFNFLHGLRAKREGRDADGADDDSADCDDADADAPPRRPTFKKRRRPAGPGACDASKRPRPTVSLAHLADEE